MRLFYKLTIWFLAVTMMSWLTGYFAVEHSKEELQKVFERRIETLTREMLEGVETRIWDRVEMFNLYTHDLILQETLMDSNLDFENKDDALAYMGQRDREWMSADKREITPFMRGLMDNRLAGELKEKERVLRENYGFRVFGEIFVTNRYGANVAMTGRTTDYRQDDEQWWQAAKKNGLFIGDVDFDESAGIYSIDLALRVDDQKGAFIGVIKAVQNIEDIISFIRKAEILHAGEDYETVSFKILDSHARVIYSTGDFSFLEKAAHLIPPAHLVPGFESSEVYSERMPKNDGTGGEVFVSHVHSKGVTGLRWILLVEQDVDEVFAPVTNLKRRILMISVFVTFLAVIIGLSIAGSISKAIEGLKETAARIGRGELDTNIDIRTTDEIGQLAGSLKQMADNLRTTTVARDELVREIGERVKAEKELRKFKFISENSNDAHFLIGRDAKFLYVNKAACKMLGYSEEELLNLGVPDVDVVYDLAKFQELFDLVQEKSVPTVESMNRRKDGSLFPSEITVTGYRIDDSSYLFAALRDITERKDTEESLRISEEKFRMLAEHSIIGISISQDGKFVYVNPHLAEIFGYKQDEMIGAQILDRVAEPDHEIVRANFRKRLSGDIPSIHYEFRALKKDGSQIDLEVHGSVMMYQGRPAVIGTLVDITERKRAAEALLTAKKEIEKWSKELEKRVKEKTEELERSQAQLVQAEKLSAVGQVAAGLAHEFNSPLAGLLPLLQKYKKTAKPGSEAFNDMALMLNAADHMARIIRDFGSFAGRPSEQRSNLEINEVIEYTLSFSSAGIKHKGIQIIREYDSGSPVIEGNRTEIQQVVLNMLTNASDAMPGGGRLVVRTGVSTDKKKVIMEFIDNGTGISRENMDRVFDPFFTTKQPGQGVGLGLSISYGIIKNHGGNIVVESAPGKGARFRVSLPALTKGVSDDA